MSEGYIVTSELPGRPATREDVCRTYLLNDFPAVKETSFCTFYELDVEEKVIFENSLRRKLRLETGIFTVAFFSCFETATPASRKLRIGGGKFLDKLLCMDLRAGNNVTFSFYNTPIGDFTLCHLHDVFSTSLYFTLRVIFVTAG